MATAAAAALAAHAAPSEQDLAALRTRIESLQRELDGKEAERREARDALRDSERAISNANRTLGALQSEGRQLQMEIARLAERRKLLERALAERQAAVERVLLARQGLAAPDALRGRIMSLYTLLSGGVFPLGAFFVGAVSEAAGVSRAFALNGALGLAALLLLVARRPRRQ